MLITIMIGLDGIISCDVKASPEFHTSWNPKSINSSVQRSKVFAKKSSLAWLVDCLDAYLRLINQAPILISNEELKKQFDYPDNSRSIYRRVNLICDHYKIHSVDSALVDLLICWRNRLTHFQAENDILASNRAILLDNSEVIKSYHCGLDIEQTLKSFDRPDLLTFKEITSFIRASTNLVYEIDKHLIRDIKPKEYADRIVIHYINSDKSKRLNNIFSKDSATAERVIRQILRQNGFTLDNDENDEDVDQYCKSISTLSYIDAKLKLQGGSFL